MWSGIRISILAFMIAFIVMFVILFYLNSMKMYTFGDLQTQARAHQQEKLTDPIKSPAVYDLIYLSSANNNWTFSLSKPLMRDFRNKRITYLLINGTLYNIQSLDQDESNSTMQLVLSPKCNKEKTGSFVSSTCEQPGWVKDSVLFVLGYYFEDAN